MIQKDKPTLRLSNLKALMRNKNDANLSIDTRHIQKTNEENHQSKGNCIINNDKYKNPNKDKNI